MTITMNTLMQVVLATVEEPAIVDATDRPPTFVEPILFAVVAIGIVTIVLGIVLCLFRMLRGPHLADRVLAADAMTLHVVGIVILLTIRLESLVFFDAALIVAIMGFASTLAFAQYIGGQAPTVPCPTDQEG